MSTRILIQLAEPEAVSGTLPAGVKQLLEGAGTSQIRASHAELPGLFTAIVPAEADLGELLERLRQSPGVRHAEADASRSTL